MRSKTETAVLTVAAIRRRKESRVTEYLFNEHEQIFAMPAGGKARTQFTTHLTRALRQGASVRTVLDPRPGIIRRIDTLSPDEAATFELARPRLEKPDRIVRLNVAAIDPATFNVVDRYLKFPTFKLCTKIVPNYKTAKKIFDFCAKQSCHLPGPPTVTPCIPFQYVRDGCYARRTRCGRSSPSATATAARRSSAPPIKAAIPSPSRFQELVQRLRRAMGAQRRVRIRVTSPHGDVIDDVQE